MKRRILKCCFRIFCITILCQMLQHLLTQGIAAKSIINISLITYPLPDRCFLIYR